MRRGTPRAEGAPRIRLALLSVRREIFRGDKATLWRESLGALDRGLRQYDPEFEIYPEPIREAEDAVAAARWLAEVRPDLALIQATTFATADCYRPLLAAGWPVALWAVTEPETGGPLPLNSLCGLNFIVSLDDAAAARPRWLYGGDSRCWRRLEAILGAALAKGALARATILAIGEPCPTFDRFAAPAEELSRIFGARVETVTIDELISVAQGVSGAEARAAGQTLAAAGTGCSLTGEQLLQAGRLELALARLVEESGCQAAALRCWPELPEQLGAMPCASVGRRFDLGVPTACEGDILGALSLVALQAMAGRAPVLLDLSHLLEQELIFWHCGNGPRSLDPTGERLLTTHFNRPELGAVWHQKVAAIDGVTMLRFSRPDEAAVFTADIARGERVFSGVTARVWGVRWQGERRLGAEQVIQTVLDRRLPHHFPFVAGRWAAQAVELADWLGLGLVAPAERPGAGEPTR